MLNTINRDTSFTVYVVGGKIKVRHDGKTATCSDMASAQELIDYRLADIVHNERENNLDKLYV